MNILQTIVLALVEGFTEFIPVSSTGHLVLLQKILNIQTTEFTKSFDIIIQLAAISAVIVYYFHYLITHKSIVFKSILAFLPMGVVGFFFYPYIKGVLFESHTVIATALILGGCVLLFIDLFPFSKNSHNITSLSTPKLLAIGLSQSISMIPGVSRSAATIIGGQIFGLSRSQSVEFSFFLAIPTMLAATSLDVIQSKPIFTSEQYILLVVGCIIAFASALISIRFFTNYVKRHPLKIFGLYRIVFGLTFLALFSR